MRLGLQVGYIQILYMTSITIKNVMHQNKSRLCAVNIQQCVVEALTLHPPNSSSSFDSISLSDLEQKVSGGFLLAILLQN